MPDDDVQLTDLEVIQRFSLAVRGASASRAAVVAALEADLAWLSGRGRRRSAPETAPVRSAEPEPTRPSTAAKAPASPAPVRAPERAPAASSASAKAPAAKPAPKPAPKAPAKAPAKAPVKARGTTAAKKAGARRA